MSIKEKFKKASKEISGRVEYMRGDKGILEDKYQDLKGSMPKDAWGEFTRIAGLAGIDLAWFLFCLSKFAAKDLKTIFIDNAVIDKWKEENKNKKAKITDSKFKQWFAKLQRTYPKTSARLKLWMLYSLVATMVAGGIKMSERDGKEDAQKSKVENVVNTPENNNDDVLDVTGEEFAQIEENGNDLQIDNKIKDVVKYNTTDADFSTKFVNENWNDIVISLLEFETWRDKATLHSGESRYTFAAGLTWVYTKEKNKDGKLIETQHACTGKYINKASNFNMVEKWSQIKRHCLYKGECVNVMKEQLKKYGFQEITDYQALGLFVAGYQTPGRLKGIVHKLSDAGSNKQKQVDAFIAGKEIKSKYRNGTNKRRWWCAMMYMGYITADDLIDLDRDAFSTININTVLKNGHFVYDSATIEYVLEHAKNPSKGSVRNFINNRKVPLNGVVAKHQKSKIENVENNKSMLKTYEGLKAFNAKDYKKAIKCYQEAIALDANNMEAYSSLAFAYKKLGDQTHSISDYEKVLETVKACNAQMNKNKSLLHDPEVKAATYYNAGLAREEIAKLQEKSNKNKDALESYQKAKQNFETAYANAQEADNTSRMDIYKDAQKRIDNAIKTLKAKDNKNKTNAFKTGQKNVSNKTAKPVAKVKGR